MMGRKDGQLRIIMMDIEELVPENHLLRKIETNIKFNFIYQKAESYYSSKGRPSIDPVCMIKKLIPKKKKVSRKEKHQKFIDTLNKTVAYHSPDCGSIKRYIHATKL